MSEVGLRLNKVLCEQMGKEIVVQVSGGKNLQDTLGISSLDIVSVQMAVEEEFGLQFATGPADRGPIDEAWDACVRVEDLEVLIQKFGGRK